MKVVYLLGSLNRGGTETLLLDVFRNTQKNHLDAQGLYRKSGELEDEFKASGVKMTHIPTRRNPLHYIYSLRKFFKRNYIQIVHAQQPLDAFYAHIACLGTKIKVVLTFHGYDFNDTRISLFVIRTIISRTYSNVYVSDFQRQYYLEKYKLNNDKQFVIYNGIAFDKLDMTEKEKELDLRAALQLNENTLLLGTVGNFNDVRDQLTICRFLYLLHIQVIDFHFIFAGKRIDTTPQQYDDCVNYCMEHGMEHKVTFLGSRNDVPHILHQLDAFMYATDHDTFGIAVVEAMAVGVPVFVNDWEVMNEITQYGKLATLYKTKDEGDLLREFMLFLQSKTDYRAKAKESAQIVRKQYSIENHIELLKQLYAKTVNSK